MAKLRELKRKLDVLERSQADQAEGQVGFSSQIAMVKELKRKVVMLERSQADQAIVQVKLKRKMDMLERIQADQASEIKTLRMENAELRRIQEQSSSSMTSTAQSRLEVAQLQKQDLVPIIEINSPFSKNITQVEISLDIWVIPQFTMYSGTTDPYEHMVHYRTMMLQWSTDDPLLCRLFPTSLDGDAIRWFYELPNNSIQTFEDLTKAFLSRYSCYRERKRDLNAVFHMKQKEGETIRNFTRRFREVSYDTEYDEDTLLVAFRDAIKPGSKLFISLSMDLPENMDELIVRAESYARLEEDILARSDRRLMRSRYVTG